MRTRADHRGYTLVELIVSVGIFAFVMLVATGAYLTLINFDRRARATNELVSNLSFAVDSITRSIRTGKSFSCTPTTDGKGNNTAGTCHQFTFVDSDGCSETYALSGGNVVLSVSGSGCSAISNVPLIDPRISLSSAGLTFYVRGVGTTSDTTQPQVIISLYGTLPVSQNGGVASTTFNIETMATQRLPEL